MARRLKNPRAFTPGSVKYFVPDRHAAAEWYSNLFGVEITVLNNPDHFFIQVGNQEVWFHEADNKVPSGAAGHVAYWQVDDFDVVLERATQLGAILYRGPLDRQDGSYMCQLKQQFQIQILTSGKGKQENQETSKRETSWNP